MDDLASKILKGLKCCFPETEEDEHRLSCLDCPYRNGDESCEAEGFFLPVDMIDDIRQLMKEKEGQE